MKIAVVAHIRNPISEPFMGGMEAHCRMLCDGLRRAGHAVTLFAAAQSVDEDLVPICAAPYEQVLPWNVYRGSPELAAYQRRAFTGAWERIVQGGFDVVHNNSLFPDLIDWAARDGVPCVTSQHVPPFALMRDAVVRNADTPFLMTTVTSHSQMAYWDMAARANMRVVHNGIECDRWISSDSVEDYFVWLGRITPNKGTAEAARAARKARRALKIFGPVEDPRYFATEVEPQLVEGVEFHGHRTLDQLRPVVAKAAGALVTPLWDEPFGLVAAEALSCGVPVCAFGNGALAEVVGDCGFVVRAGDVEALAMAMKRAPDVSRAACRERALACFSVEAMIAGYEGCYARVIGASRAQATASFASSNSSTAALLA
jgi:glycosyltransferase involved in cell wall biosynthesis